MRSVRRPTGAAPPPADTIHDTALRMLGRRALSRAEVAERLEARGFQAAVVRAEVTRLEGAGLLDDVALARSVCQAQIRAGRGRRAILAALRRRLIAGDVAGRALDDVAEGDESAALAASLARVAAKHRFWRRLPEERRKVMRYLLARGFGLDAVRRALAEAQEVSGEDAEPAPGGVEAIPRRTWRTRRW